MQKIKSGDIVKIVSGKDKGKEGKVEKVLPKLNTFLIPGVNLYKKHVKPFGDQKGGIYELPRPLPFSKIALICPKCKKVTRVGIKVVGKEKLRICRKCKREIDSNK